MADEAVNLPGPAAETAEWSALAALAAANERHDVRASLADSERQSRLVVEACGLRADFTRQLCDVPTLDLLLALARTQEVGRSAAAMFRGEHVNATQDRPALHTALRIPPGESLVVGAIDVAVGVHSELDRMASFCDAVAAGERVGHNGKKFTAVVNIGIGGSNLGPRMATEALRPFAATGLDVRFVSNVDPADLDRALTGLDPETTLFVICSKSFTTLETLTNAQAARAWLISGAGGDESAVGAQMVAVSTGEDEVAEFGIDPKESMFGFWDWVGGRYSVGSAVGLTLMLSIGPDNFRAFLAGMREMDEHFASAPPESNLPLLLGLIWLWNGSIFGHETAAVLPYSSDLREFPMYLQQLDMESNGKSVRADGTPVGVQTGPVVWGDAGTDSQHSFHQLLHQGTRVVPCDLIGFAKAARAGDQDRQDLLTANMVAQAEALSVGRTVDEVGGDPTLAPHRTFPGGRPVTVILAEQLDPRTLGRLIALYEHKVFVQAAIWGINPFDQWGVDLGKELAGVIAPELAGENVAGDHDPSTEALLDAVRQLRSH